MDKILTEKLRCLVTPCAGVTIRGAANALAARMTEGAGLATALLAGAGLANSGCARQM